MPTHFVFLDNYCIIKNAQIFYSRSSITWFVEVIKANFYYHFVIHVQVGPRHKYVRAMLHANEKGFIRNIYQLMLQSSTGTLIKTLIGKFSAPFA